MVVCAILLVTWVIGEGGEGDRRESMFGSGCKVCMGDAGCVGWFWLPIIFRCDISGMDMSVGMSVGGRYFEF